MSDNVFQASQPTVPVPKSTDIPVESVTLPSQGKIYPLGHPLNNEKQVEIKCMTAKEEDLLTSRALIKNGTVITQLLRSCLINKAIDPDDLFIGDRSAIMMAIRITGYGPEYNVKMTCPVCKEECDYEFSLSDLKVKPLSAQPIVENENIFEYILPKSGQKVQFRLLTARDDIEMSKTAEARKKLKQQVDNNVTGKLFTSIISIAGETDRSKLVSMVSNMRAQDSRALRKYIDEIEPGVEMKQIFICPKCQDESEVNIPLGMTFFWPDSGL